RVSVTRKHAFSTQTRLSDCEVRSCACSDFRDLGVLVEKEAKLIACLREATASELLVCALESSERCRLIDSRLSRRRRSRRGTSSAKRSELLGLFVSRLLRFVLLGLFARRDFGYCSLFDNLLSCCWLSRRGRFLGRSLVRSYLWFCSFACGSLRCCRFRFR